MKVQAFPVPTKVIIDQGELSKNELRAPGNAARVAALAKRGIASSFADTLATETQRLSDAESLQERAKTAATAEAKEDKDLAERGYRWKLALDACVRTHQAMHDAPELSQTFRFGKLKNNNARNVLYELCIALPEAEARKGILSKVGADDAFLQTGRDILTGLSSSREETAAAVTARKNATAEVEKQELVVSRLLSQLVAADEAHCLLVPGDAPIFRIDRIRTEMARVEAAREARVAATVNDTNRDDD